MTGDTPSSNAERMSRPRIFPYFSWTFDTKKYEKQILLFYLLLFLAVIAAALGGTIFGITTGIEIGLTG